MQYNPTVMDLPNTLILLARDPELCAWRDRGVVIHLTAGHVIERVFVKKPYRWNPSFADMIATDWQTGTIDQLQKRLRQLTEEGEG